MFQSIKRAKFISSHNFASAESGDGARMHLWLQENGWPANEFVDLLMAGSKGHQDYIHDLNFRIVTEGSYLIVREQSNQAVGNLYEFFNKPEYIRHDTHRLIPMLQELKKKLDFLGIDCEKAGGQHEWYNQDNVHSKCYHCSVVKKGQLWRKDNT